MTYQCTLTWRINPEHILRITSNRNFKLVLLAFIFTNYIIWSRYGDISDNLYYDGIEVLSLDVLRYDDDDFRYTAVYSKKKQLPKDVKFILLWSRSDMVPLYNLGHGQKAFIKNNCSSINCYATDNKKFFGGDLTRFNAIAFNGRDRQLNDVSPEYYLPHERTPYQKYIFFNSESASNYPIHSKFYNGYFNWTATYRLDSDFVVKYLTIMNKKGNVVGPKVNMKWLDKMDDIDEAFRIRLNRKRFAAAWFVSNCKSLSLREVLVSELQKELEKYQLDVHIYGRCGNYKCSRSIEAKCNEILERDYYFYLSFENSSDKDYVTEKVLTALHHDVVPIVYGGANYSRFLPPGSYINAGLMSVQKLASLMDRLIKKPKLYHKYFKWKRYYTYARTKDEFVCALCASLNGKKFEEYSSYDDFILWWNQNH